MSSALSEKLSERASAALASSIFAATVARVDLAIAPISRSSPSSAPRPPPSPPAARLNVLYIVSDDLRAEIGPYGHSWPPTPHLDALANASVVLEQAYAQYALCNPSRNSFLTGRRPAATGVTADWSFGVRRRREAADLRVPR